ncbi:MAG: hypothetical protein FJW32_13395 [Acidobacteria bacterium]|nr:hypothetical protein [Acidobacteriota bacterium]
MKLRSLLLAAFVALVANPAAVAQMTCVASAPNPTFLRSNGLSELAGDVVITCRGGTPVTSGAFPTINLNMFFNTGVTSRVLVPASPGGPGLTEAVLIIDTPAAADQRPCLTPVCNNTDNIIQSRYDGFNSLSWQNIPVNPPGPNADRILRVRNVRLNASTLPPNGPALVFISLSGAQVQTLNNPQQTIANARAGITFEARGANDAALAGPISLTACTAYNIDLAGNAAASAYSTPGGRTMTIKFSEGFANAFKRRTLGTSAAEPQASFSQDNPIVYYNTESGFTNPALPATNGFNRVGFADSGTTLRAVFTNIPAGTRVYVGTRELASGSTLDATGAPTTKARLTATPGAPFTPLAADNQLDGGLKLVPASGEVSWEVLETDVNAGETVAFAVVIAYGAGTQPSASLIAVNGGFGPQSTVTVGTGADPISRFAGLTGPVPLIAINACRTSLLFQFITNQAGFDTGIAVSNTSRDTLSTAAQNGRCTATFFPTPFNATTQAQFPPLPSPALQGGEQWTFTVSGARPGFQGYMMVNCDFQFAHGYAFISDFGSKNLAQGYQALVVPDRPRIADPFSSAGAGTGEQLVH